MSDRSHHYAFWLDSEWIERFKKHSSLVRKVEVDMADFVTRDGDGCFVANAELAEALRFFGWRMPSVDPSDFNDVRDPDETRYYVGLVRDHDAPNPAARIIVEHRTSSDQSKDFFDLLRDLDRLLRELQDYIRGINDPGRANSAVSAAAACIDAFRAFVDAEKDELPETIPAGLAPGLFERLSRISWMTLPERVYKMIDNIQKIMETLGFMK